MNQMFLIIMVLGLWYTVSQVQVRTPVAQVDKKYLKPPVALKHFTFGYNDFIASVLWIRLLQNFDYCEAGKYSEEDYVEPEHTEKDKVTSILTRPIKPAKCHKGWVYSMLEVMTEIQPQFHLAYDTGAMFLSIMVDDREGARLIFEKGLKIYKTDWRLAFHAAYHYLWEVQDPARAASLFQSAAELGAPEWVIALSAALYTKVGQAQIAKTILSRALENNPNGKENELIKARLKTVEDILSESQGKNP